MWSNSCLRRLMVSGLSGDSRCMSAMGVLGSLMELGGAGSPETGEAELEDLCSRGDADSLDWRWEAGDVVAFWAL